jgi:hypothetical protein
MRDNEFFNEQESDADCIDSCQTVDKFMHLTDEMIKTIIDLEEEVVRWRQILIKYLPDEWAEGLRDDILCNLARGFEGDPAYDLYVNAMRGGADPQQDEETSNRMQRLADGTDETSITYL